VRVHGRGQAYSFVTVHAWCTDAKVGTPDPGHKVGASTESLWLVFGPRRAAALPGTPQKV
jgi:hypothetical protein